MKELKNGKVGKSAVEGTVEGFFSEFSTENYKGLKKYCSDLFYQENFVDELAYGRGLDLNNYNDLIIAAGIFAAIVGTSFFAPEALPAALALI